MLNEFEETICYKEKFIYMYNNVLSLLFNVTVCSTNLKRLCYIEKFIYNNILSLLFNVTVCSTNLKRLYVTPKNLLLI